MPNNLEIACFSLEAARIAQAAGASRIEFCAGKSLGGITPPFDLIAAARAEISLPLYVMIRPRGGDFVYNEAELAEMKQAILFCEEIGIEGFVFGILSENKTINIVGNQALVRLAAPLPCTFHRAFDAVLDKKTALEQLIHCGFQCLLTSGGEGNAEDFLPQLAALIQQAQQRIVVMPGGGIRSHNIAHIQQVTQASMFHSAGILQGELPDEGEIRRAINPLGTKNK